MKESDFSTVTKLLNIKGNCKRALIEAVDWMEGKDLNKPDSGGVSGFEYGFWCCINSHSDGSGEGIDATGCYVGRQVAEAVIQVLRRQIDALDERLKSFGVNVEKP